MNHHGIHIALIGLVCAGMAAAESPWVPLFNGADLTGWTVKCRPADRDREYWSVAEGEILVNSIGDRDHDYVWLQSQADFGDFELRLKFKVYQGISGNSGVQIRSRYDDEAGWLDGPQVDIHPPMPHRTGLIYDETRSVKRWIYPSLQPGDHAITPEMSNPRVRLHYGDEGWNELAIIARGSRIQTFVNGEQVADYDGTGVLDDAAHRRYRVGLNGHLALQLHARDELKARFKDLVIRRL